MNESLRYRIAALCALFGAMFCLLAAMGATEALCVTQGCAFYKGTTLFGIDLYHLGAVGFGFIALSSLAAVRSSKARPFLTTLLVGALVFDAVLLLIQAGTASCVNCLIVAFFLGLTALCTFPLHSRRGLLLALWTFCFTAALAGAARESITPQALYGPEEANIKIFFSPTCPSCKALVEKFLTRDDLNPDVAFYPVAKNNKDLIGIALFRQSLIQGKSLSEALALAWTTDSSKLEHLGFTDRLQLHTISMRNKLALLHAGYHSVPLVITNSQKIIDCPTQYAPTAPHSSTSSSPLDPLFSKPSTTCGFFGGEDCESVTP
ncbi:vitamin K epoxide reductase family protein [Desulfovibrio inopinatus]|uniref:vitamin K epoxide reductase family protein n=1 Tax=Desulfovibrio inopinatus TaxID=102109 RepID=UPI00041A7CD7|nr:vitamin K epoxide reductase family protein [Desulfovibrio inopinatus]